MNTSDLAHGNSVRFGMYNIPGSSVPTVNYEEDTSFLARILSVARRRKQVIIGAIVACLAAGIVVTLLMQPQYTASAIIEIQRETGNFAEVQGADKQGGFIDQEFYATQYGLLQSRSLAERVAKDLRLSDDPGFFENMGADVSDEWFDGRVPLAGASTRDQRQRVAGELLLANFALEPGRLSRLVELKFTSPSPELSRRVIDAWSKNFVAATIERRMDATSYARNVLEQRLAQLRTRIDEAERASVDYASAQGIVNLPGATGADGSTGEQSLVGTDLATLNRELSVATAERIGAESRLRASGDNTSEALSSPTIANLRQRRAELAAEYARLMTQFEPGYPPAAALRNQITQLDRSISSEENRIGETLTSTYQAATRREAALQARVNALKGDVLDLRRRSIQYNIIQRDADTNKQLYDALLQRYKAIGIAGGIGATNISVVDPAHTPVKPSSPRVLLNLLLALATGLGLGIFLAWALEQVEQSISDPSEVEQDLRLPLLGAIPRLEEEEPIVALQDPKSMTSEAYLSLFTRLSFATDHGAPKVIAVTSSQPAEGKTTTSYALATSMARTARNVIIVDTDMRSPSIHDVTGLSNKRGLSNYLAGDDEALDAIVTLRGSGLHVLVAGPRPPSTPELLSSARFEKLLADLSAKFDHVVLDAPPVMGLADAAIIAKSVSSTVFIIEAHRTSKKSARAAIERLQASRGNVVGAVLTKLDSKLSTVGHGYGYGYGYGHAYGANNA